MKLSFGIKFQLFSIAVIFFIGFISYRLSEALVKDSLKYQIEEKLTNHAQYIRNTLELYFLERSKELARVYEQNKGDSVLQNYFAGEFRSVCIYFPSGRTVCNSNPENPSAYSFMRSQSYSEHLFSMEEKNVMYYGKQFDSVYVIGTLPSDQVFEVLKASMPEEELHGNLGIELFDDDGQVIFSSDQTTPKSDYPYIFQRIVNLLFDPSNTFSEDFFEFNQNMYFLSADLGYHHLNSNLWYLVLSVPKKSVYAPLESLRRDSAFVLIGIIVLAVFLTFLFSMMVTRRLDKLRSLMAEYADGNLDHIERFRIQDEFSEIAERMHLMAGQLKKSVILQRKLRRALELRKDTSL